MPWPMVHFSIAEQLWDQIPSPEFLLGSIAPDAIHMREGTTRQDKGRTHLCKDDGTMPNLTDFDNFYNMHGRSDNQSFNLFMLGYISHIFTDLRWTESVWKDYVEKVSGEFPRQNEALKSRYNREVCQIEYHLCRSENWTDRVLASVLQAKAYSVPSLLHESEVKQYGELVVRNLRDTSNEPHIALCYITDQIVAEFIEQTVDELKELVRVWSRGENQTSSRGGIRGGSKDEKMDCFPSTRSPMCH